LSLFYDKPTLRNQRYFVGKEKTMPQTTNILPEDRELLKSVGLTEGGWRALYPLPILRVAWLDEELTLEENEELQERLCRATATLLEGAGESELSAAVAFSNHYLKPGFSKPDQKAVLERASAALCWHMARDIPLMDRQRYMERVGELAREVLTGQELEADSVIEEMQLMIDIYLGREIFEPLSRDQLVFEVYQMKLAERFGAEPDGVLLLSPMVELLERQGGRVSAKDHVKVLCAALSDAQPMGLAFLSEGLEAWCAGSGADLSSQSSRGQLASILAELDYANRECVLRSLSDAMSRVSVGGLLGMFSKPLFTAAVVKESLDSVRNEVDSIRRGRK
jgi:hypothetical protein